MSISNKSKKTPLICSNKTPKGITLKPNKMKHTITTTHDHTTGRDLFVVLTPDGFDAYGEGFNTEAEAQKRAKELDEYAEHFGGDLFCIDAKRG